MPRAQSAQLKLEHYYKVAVDSAIERNTRRVELERRLQSETMKSEERKNRQLHQLGKKESTFLRLRRTKLGLGDFRTVKVIGKGAFGEVRKTSATWTIHSTSCIIIIGQIGPEDRYRKDIRHEAVEERRHVEERSGMHASAQQVDLSYSPLASSCSSRT